MPRRCTVCDHDEAHLINVELVSRVPYRDIERRFGVGRNALKRHCEQHVPQLLVKASEAVESASADDLLGEVRSLHTRTLDILEAAEEAQDLRVALGAIRESRGNLELLAKLRQLIDTSPTINILISPEVQVAILQALDPYPEARVAVADALASLEAAS